MKSNCIMAVLFNAFAAICFSAMRTAKHEEVWALQLIGFVLLAFGILFTVMFLVDLIDRIDKLSKLDNLYKKMADIESRIYRTNEVLDDINRHICDGFNGIAEVISEK